MIEDWVLWSSDTVNRLLDSFFLLLLWIGDWPTPFSGKLEFTSNIKSILKSKCIFPQYKKEVLLGEFNGGTVMQARDINSVKVHVPCKDPIKCT